MSLNTLQTAYANGEIIDASHVNELTLSLLGEFVGRNSSGVPTSGQSLGTLALPWGNLYATGIILNGLALDTSLITSLPNRIVSGNTRALSSQPDFLRAIGTGTSFTITGASTDLVLAINNTAVSINSDIVTGGVVLAPGTNNTADVNDTNIVNDLYAGEIDAAIPEIKIDSVGSEISNLVGQIAAFKTPTGEIFQALVKDATTLTNVFRGYYFDDSGSPIVRGNLSNNDQITLMSIGWVFVEDNGTTIDVSYLTPSISYNAPNSPATGQYWFDISNQVWKRYSGTSFDIINRILIGQVVSDDTNTIAARSLDFSKNYQEFNNIEVELSSSEIVKSKQISSRASVYGEDIFIDVTKLSWNITTDLEAGLTESSNQVYYLYLSDEGQEIVSDKRPYNRIDLKGYYHPYHSYLCVGSFYNNSSSDIVATKFVPYNSEVHEQALKIQHILPASTNAGDFNSGIYVVRDLNTLTYGDFSELDVNRFLLFDGKYKIKAGAGAFRVNEHAIRLVRDPAGTPTEVITGTTEYADAGGGSSWSRLSSDNYIVDKAHLHQLEHICGATKSINGLGVAGSWGNNVFSFVDIIAIK